MAIVCETRDVRGHCRLPGTQHTRGLSGRSACNGWPRGLEAPSVDDMLARVVGMSGAKDVHRRLL